MRICTDAQDHNTKPLRLVQGSRYLVQDEIVWRECLPKRGPGGKVGATYVL